MGIGLRQVQLPGHDLLKGLQHRAALCLDHRQHIRPGIKDHPGRQQDRGGVHGFGLQLDPADPVLAPRRHDLARLAAVARTPDQLAADLAQAHKGALVVIQHPQQGQQLQHPHLVGLRIDRLFEKRVDLGMGIQNLLVTVTVIVEHTGAVEQILDVVGGNTHLDNPLALNGRRITRIRAKPQVEFHPPA